MTGFVSFYFLGKERESGFGNVKFNIFTNEFV